jgi:hypothetical protein
MEIIKEPLEVDFVVDPRPLSKEEEKAISNFIKADKEKRRKQKNKKSKSALRTKQQA